MEPYPQKQLLFAIPDVEMGRIAIQYQETDWAFLNRFLSGMADPNSRYLRNRFGQELMLCPEYVRLSCGGETSQVTVLDSGRIDIVAQDKVMVGARETIYLHAEEDVFFRMANKFEADSTDGGQLICYEDKVCMNGTKVRHD